MRAVHSLARWGSLAAMLVGAAASVALTALVQACGGKTEPTEVSSGDGGRLDAQGSDASDADARDGKIALDAITPQNDVSLDQTPAE